MMNCDFSPIDVEDEYEKFVIRMNPPRVTVDNIACNNSTLVKVDSANKYGSLLEVVQVLSDLNLTIKRAYISSDGSWFMDVFHVVDQNGNKLYDEEVTERIQQSLSSRTFNSFRSLKRSVGVQSTSNHTSIELIGQDRPGLLSEIFAVLSDLNCNIVACEVWTHDSRMASVVYVTDKSTNALIEDQDRLNTIKRLLKYVLRGSREWSGKTSITMDVTHTERRLHQMMFADRECDRNDGDCYEVCDGGDDDRNKGCVTVENCVEKDYTVVYVKCKDRPKLLFDTVCTLTDMKYVVYHGTVISEGPQAYQEYYIRNMHGEAVCSKEEKQRITDCLEAAIRRGDTKGLRLELCMEDRSGLLSDVTRIFREHGLSVTRAEVATRGNQAVNIFYVTDASGSNPVRTQTIEAIRNEIGETVLCVKDDYGSESSSRDRGRFSIGNLFRTRSEKFLFSLGLIRSGS